MATLRSVCVYCGSSTGVSPRHLEDAKKLGELLAKEGLRLVYGGGAIGLMGAIAHAVIEHGGQVTGIIPEFLLSREIQLSAIQDKIIVPDMHVRKMTMYERADAFVALPGGIGTLEELVEQMTWAQLGRHRKPIAMLNADGFWNPLRHLVAHMKEQGFIRAELAVNYLSLDTVEEIIPALRAAVADVPEGALGASNDGVLKRL